LKISISEINEEIFSSLFLVLFLIFVNPDKPSNNPMPSPNPSQTAQPVEIRFDCQLAHGGPVCEVKNFRNIKELYFRMAEAIGVDVNKILFVTGIS